MTAEEMPPVSARGMPSAQLRAEVAVVGAGPAGSMAAFLLARAGHDVVVLDRAAFPRDKACGDGLMPDALAALRAAGLLDRALAGARRHDTLRIYAPNGTPVSIAGDFAVLPRFDLDARICHAAVEAGARLLAPVRVEGPLEAHGRICGVRGTRRGGEPTSVRADLTVLATGADSGALRAFGVCERNEPSATALRFYVTVEGRPDVDPGALCVSYDRSICPGYGWVFPGPAGSFNVGVGYFYDAPALPAITNLRLLMDQFLQRFPPVRAIAEAGGQATAMRGAPLRTGMTGSRVSAPGLIVVGDAAGLTYSISGEGIGKAMESGMLAAELIHEGRAAAYEAVLRQRMSKRFVAYAGAQRWVAHPRLIDFLAWRANGGTYVRRQIEGLVNETTDPRAILSVRGLLRSVLT